MTPAILTVALAVLVWYFVHVCATTQPAPEAAHRAVQPHRPLMGQPAPRLPRRKPGLAALKAEIQLTPVDRTPSLRIRKQHPDWAWDTDAHRLVWDSWFQGQPTDQAVMLVEVRS